MVVLMDALPCIRCGKMLQRDIDDYEVQPRDGVIIETRGNYGSRVFDPVVSGDVLFMNLCDDCLVWAGDNGYVRAGVSAIPVKTTTPWKDRDGAVHWGQTMVGWKRVARPLVNWSRSIPNDDEYEYLTLDEILERFDDDRYSWNLKREHYEQMRDEEAV